MAELWASLLPILLADVLNPVLFAFMVYAAGTQQPLAAYNLAYALPFITVPMLRAVMGGGSQALLERINAVIDRAASFMMPLMLFAVGAALVTDAVYFFATGNFLIDLS